MCVVPDQVNMLREANIGLSVQNVFLQNDRDRRRREHSGVTVPVLLSICTNRLSLQCSDVIILCRETSLPVLRCLLELSLTKCCHGSSKSPCRRVSNGTFRRHQGWRWCQPRLHRRAQASMKKTGGNQETVGPDHGFMSRG